MKARGIKLFSVAHLIPPEGSEGQLDKKLVDQLAASFECEGLREPLVVVAKGQHRAWIRHGVHRWAAAKQVGWRTIECVVEPQTRTTEEHRAKVIVENLIRHECRGPKRDALLAELVGLRERIIEAREDGGNSLPPQRGPYRMPPTAKPKQNKKSHSRARGARTARGRAREEVAKTAGTTPKGVERAEKKTKKRQQEKTQKSEPTDQHMDPRGVVIPDRLWVIWEQLDQGLVHLEKPLKIAAKKVRELQATAEGVGDAYSARWGQYAQRWDRTLKSMRHELGSIRPAVVCPHCKGKGCKQCDAVGFFAKYQIKNSPELQTNKGKLKAIEGLLENDT